MKYKLKYIYIFMLLFSLQPATCKNGWYELNSGTDKFLYGVCFVDSLYGWAVGDEGLIIHTKDGGKSWAGQDANVGSWLLSVSFVDRMNGWAVGDKSRIRHTSNGGGTWEIQSSIVFPEVLNSVYFVNEKHGWATGPSGIIHTDDGGNNWFFQDSGTFNASKSIFFVNNDVGWACGANGTIIQTFDGGMNWEKQNTGNTGTIYDVFFLDLSIGWAVGRHEPKLLRTTNGGLNWTPQDSPVPGFFTKIQFVDKNNGWAAGQGGIIHSTDGGKTWKVQIPDSRYNLWWMSFTDKNKGWAVGGDGTILKTDNGGIKFIVDFKASVLSGEAPLSTTFTDLSDGAPTQWSWNFGDGGTHTTQNPIYIYQEPGVYTVSLEISDGIDSDRKTKPGYIVVTGGEELIADFVADTTEGTEPFTVQFYDSSKGNPDKWEWDFGDGGTHTAQNPLHIYQSSGTFTVSLKVFKNSKNSTKERVDYIIVNKPIEVRDDIENKYLKLYSPSPNPSTDYLNIKYETFADADISLSVYDIFGREIKKIYQGFNEQGSYSYSWNMKDDNNKAISPGIYYFCIKILTNKGIYQDYEKFIYIK